MKSKLEKLLATSFLAGALSFNSYSQGFDKYNEFEEEKSNLEYLEDVKSASLKEKTSGFDFSSKGILETSKESKEKPDYFYRGLQASYVALSAADYISTVKGLEKEGAFEANPFARKLLGNKFAFVGVKAGLTGLNLFLVDKLLYKDNPKVAKGSLIGLNLIYSAVVANNISVNIKLNH